MQVEWPDQPVLSLSGTASIFYPSALPRPPSPPPRDGDDYLNLGIREGGVFLCMSLGSGKLELQIKPKRVRFDDNQWHKLTVHRRVQELSLVVDGVYAEHSNTAGTFTMLSSSRAYVGGAENVLKLSGSKVHNNFVGCLRKGLIPPCFAVSSKLPSSRLRFARSTQSC
ncbi:unnamed protein product [Nezara viridula]|uniref:Laminin G domain-containing protein n=1 Tax=Nezara viridula TaxID=85310 RepID=A0A9P0HCR5_NEZVI|nr:unnamed protein product [Nezara viridula]